MTNINLLPPEERASESFEKLRQRLSVASFAVLAVAVVLTLGTLIFYSILGRERANLNKKHSDNAARLNDLKTTEDKIVVVKDKLKLANTVVSTRLDVSSVFNKVAELVPTGVYFSDIKIATDKVSINGKAKSSSDMAGLVSSLTSDKGKLVLTNISVDSLSSDDKGIYSFALTASLVTKPPEVKGESQ